MSFSTDSWHVCVGVEKFHLDILKHMFSSPLHLISILVYYKNNISIFIEESHTYLIVITF